MSEDEKLEKALEAIIKKYGVRKIHNIIKKFNYKICPQCKNPLHHSKFKKRLNGNLESYCIECAKKYNRNYQKNYRRR